MPYNRILSPYLYHLTTYEFTHLSQQVKQVPCLTHHFNQLKPLPVFIAYLSCPYYVGTHFYIHHHLLSSVWFHV